MSEIPKWHYSMLNDDARNASFHHAISQLVRATDDVVDIGAGTGLLTILAARAGARSVDAFEAHPQMAQVAAETLAASGIQDRVALHRTLSLNVEFRPDDRATWLVTEIFDCALIGEGILPTLRHARRSLLAEGYGAIPQSATLSGALVAAPRMRQLNEVHQACGVDISRLNRLQTKGHLPVRLATWPHSLVSEEERLYHLDLRDAPSQSPSWDVPFTAIEAASVDGVVAWFAMDVGAGQQLTTHPTSESHWMQAFMPFPEPERVAAGQVLPVHFTIHDDATFIATPLPCRRDHLPISRPKARHAEARLDRPNNLEASYR